LLSSNSTACYTNAVNVSATTET